MNDLLNPTQLNEAIQDLLNKASKRVTCIVPQPLLPIIDLESLAHAAELRPEIHVVLIITHPFSDGVDSLRILSALSRMPHLCIFTSKGEYQGTIASEHDSVVIPGMAHPLSRTHSFASSLGANQYPQIERAIQEGQLVFCKSPVYSKTFFGLRKKYVGSKVKSRKVQVIN